MADFIKLEENPVVVEETPKVEEEKKVQKICVVSISEGSPYDSSELPNTESCYYVSINFTQMKELYYVLKEEKETNNMIFKNVFNYMKDRDTMVFFDFKCCSECHSGSHFVNTDKTLTVYKMINVLTRKHCNFIVGDHSMGALFNNWNQHRMDFPSPITIEPETTGGRYSMNANKTDFMNSIHPILKNLGDLSSDEKIKIEFENMGGTKIYTVNPETKVEVKVLSKGKPLDGRREGHKEKPVHCEFKYRKGKIIVSATHWCNLTEVNSKVDVNKIRREFTTQYGEECANDFEVEYSEAIKSGDKKRVDRVVSDSVRQICSATPAPFMKKKDFKKIDMNNNDD